MAEPKIVAVPGCCVALPRRGLTSGSALAAFNAECGVWERRENRVTIGEMLEYVCSNTPRLTPLSDVARLKVVDGAALARHSKFVSRARELADARCLQI